jgi:AcrR family transcriptional regulator
VAFAQHRAMIAARQRTRPLKSRAAREKAQTRVDSETPPAGRKRVRARPPGRPRGEQPGAARERILDNAEILFALHGFHGVAVRDVTRAAGVDVALLHYHFSTKRGLLDAVFSRRAEILNQDRHAAFAEIEPTIGPGEASVVALIDAFLRPPLQRCAHGGPGWKAYGALLAQVANTPDWGGETMARSFDPVVHRLIAGLRKALPNAADEDLYWAFQFMSGVLALTLADTSRTDLLSKGLVSSHDFIAATDRMVSFCAAGFMALAGE